MSLVSFSVSFIPYFHHLLFEVFQNMHSLFLHKYCYNLFYKISPGMNACVSYHWYKVVKSAR